MAADDLQEFGILFAADIYSYISRTFSSQPSGIRGVFYSFCTCLSALPIRTYVRMVRVCKDASKKKHHCAPQAN